MFIQPSQAILLKSGSGANVATSASNVDSVAISGLTALDTIVVYAQFQEVTQADNGGGVTLYNSTDGVTLTFAALAMALGETLAGQSTLSQSQNSATSVIGFHTEYGTTRGIGADARAAVVTQSWTGSWTLALRDVGVTAGGTRRWRWSVYKMAGQ